MLDWFINLFTTLSTNPMATGILGSTLIAGLIYWCREIPKQIWFAFWNSVTIKLNLVEENSPTAYDIFEEELRHTKIYYITGTFQLVFRFFRKELDVKIGEYGIFFCKLAGKWCLVQKYTDRQVSLWHAFCYDARFFTRDKELLDNYFKDAWVRQRAMNEPDQFTVLHYTDDRWNAVPKLRVSLPEFTLTLEKRQVCERIEYFLKNKAEYRKQEKPYREGFVLSGDPGTGKSYFIQQVASKFGLNIYYVNLNSFATDSAFVKALLLITLPSIILFEDIDDAEITHSRSTYETKHSSKISAKDVLTKDGDGERKTGVTLATLLNAFDGLLAQDGQLVFVTTNHIDKLDPALVRAGRFNTNVVFKALNGIEINNLINKMYGVEVDWDMGKVYISAAELTGMCGNKSLSEIKEILYKKIK